jgi:ABC-2 type transport system ATP-binding protein
MEAVTTERPCKEFITTRKNPGFRGALKAMLSPERSLRKAVSHFSLSIPRGEIVGPLGSNGAGKTTLIKMLTGIVVPSSGTGRVYPPRAFSERSS